MDSFLEEVNALLKQELGEDDSQDSIEEDANDSNKEQTQDAIASSVLETSPTSRLRVTVTHEELALYETTTPVVPVTVPATADTEWAVTLYKRSITIATITGGGASANSSDPTGSSSGSKAAMPTLSTTGVPQPSVTVPSMADNPFMDRASVPEGTVFIATGAVLGGLLGAVIVWRIIASLMLRRSLKRNETAGFMTLGDDKQPLYAGGAVVGSRDNLSGNGGGRKSGAPSLSTRPSSMFFSPTAEVMNSAQGRNESLPSVNQRSSVYLPAGYYQNNVGSQLGSMTSRSSRVLSMAGAPSISGVAPPPAAPAAAPAAASSSPGHNRIRSYNGVSSSPQQPQPSAQRPPSAYLDDLLADRR